MFWSDTGKQIVQVLFWSEEAMVMLGKDELSK